MKQAIFSFPFLNLTDLLIGVYMVKLVLFIYSFSKKKSNLSFMYFCGLLNNLEGDILLTVQYSSLLSLFQLPVPLKLPMLKE